MTINIKPCFVALFIAASYGTHFVEAAETFTVDGLKYTINSPTAQTATVSGVDGASITDVVIPKIISLNGIAYEVSEIGGLAFQKSNITSISIPNTIIRVNKKAFDGCASLERVVIEDGNTSLYLSNDYSYDGDSDHAEGRNIFSSCPLKEVYIGRNLTYPSDNSDGYSPFACHGINKAEIGANVTVLNRNLFWGCTELKEITFTGESKLTSIEDEALSNCGLETLSFPDATTEVSGEFRQCKSMTKIHFGKSLKNIPLAFFRFNSLREIDVDANNETYSSENGVLYSRDKRTLMRVPLASTNVEIAAAETIATNAFRDCAQLHTIIFPDNTKEIKRYAATGNTELRTIVLPESVQAIEAGGLGTYYYKMSERWFNDGAELYSYEAPEGCLISKAQTPPIADNDAFHGREAWTLWVPEGCANAYAAADGWKIFSKVIEGPCHLTVKSNIATAGDVTGTGDYLPGESVNLSVTPLNPDKYIFTEWGAGNSIISTEPDFKFNILQPISEITACFEPIPDAAKDEVEMKVIDRHLIISIKQIENGETYITRICDPEGEIIATVKGETTTSAGDSTASTGSTDNILNSSETYTYHTRIYDSENSLLAYYTGNFSGAITSIGDIEADYNTEETIYYNLQGMRVGNPTSGFYIVRHGNTISKEFVK